MKDNPEEFKSKMEGIRIPNKNIENKKTFFKNLKTFLNENKVEINIVISIATLFIAGVGIWSGIQQISLYNKNIETQIWLDRPIIVPTEFICPRTFDVIDYQTNETYSTFFQLNNLGKSPGGFILSIIGHDVLFMHPVRCENYKNECNLGYIIEAGGKNNITFYSKIEKFNQQIGFNITVSCTDNICDKKEVTFECNYNRNESRCSRCFDISKKDGSTIVQTVIPAMPAMLGIILIVIISIIIAVLLFGRIKH